MNIGQNRRFQQLAMLIPIIVSIVLGMFSPVGSAQEEGGLSYGMVKKHVKPGESSQVEILKLFGSPDNMVLKKGKETWVYDRFKVETSVSSESGYGTIIFAGSRSSKMTTSTSVRNITVIIEFSANGIVEDFSMRVGGY